MSGPDRRHSVVVAWRVERSLGHEASGPVVAAALLHDVGKTQSGLGTYGRVVADAVGVAVGRDPRDHRELDRAPGASPAAWASTSSTPSSAATCRCST